jgi:hypothetical protein
MEKDATAEGQMELRPSGDAAEKEEKRKWSWIGKKIRSFTTNH